MKTITSRILTFLGLFTFILGVSSFQAVTRSCHADEPKQLRAGIIGLDTSHATAFAKLLNDENVKPDLANCRVVAAYPKGSPDIESSVVRVPAYTKAVQGMGVEIVDSIAELLKRVDVVLLETNDGRPHLEQVLPVLKAGKRVFIDKPIAGSLADAVAIFEASKHYNVPLFSSSSLRHGEGTLAVRNGSIGKVTRCETHSPCSLEKTHPDLYWYGIHGVESLFTVMGTGCVSVRRTESTPDHDFVEGIWDGGRTGTFRGYRKGGKGGYGGHAYGDKGDAPVGMRHKEGYRPLLVDIVKYFRTGEMPVQPEETIEIYAFMEAADESKRQNGAVVTLESVLTKARAEAAKKLDFEISAVSTGDNSLTAEEKKAGWQLLFNGKDYTGWKCNNDKPIKSVVEEGCLMPYKSGGYLLIHEKQYGDFVLKCDVKYTPNCNSGIFFRVGNAHDPVQTGMELQIYSGQGTGYHDFGAIYDLVKPTKNTSYDPGKWNAIKLTCKGPHVTVEVNGTVVSEMNCDQFDKPNMRPDGSAHKFRMAVKDFPRKGYVGFQDHGHKVWYKNIKLLELTE